MFPYRVAAQTKNEKGSQLIDSSTRNNKKKGNITKSKEYICRGVGGGDGIEQFCASFLFGRARARVVFLRIALA